MNFDRGEIEEPSSSIPLALIDPRNFEPPQFLEWAKANGCREETSRRWLAAVVGRDVHDRFRLAAGFQVPKRLLDLVVDPLPRLMLERVDVSSRDGFEKLLFRTTDRLAVETVLIPLHKQGAVSICLSSQVGCAMACGFCATARMPVRRNLETWEIIDQFAQARQRANEQGRRVTGAVFMGMGEPFLNYDRVLAAAELLSSPIGAAVAAKAITISTVGLIREIDRYTTERRRFRLAISLGAAIDEKRAKIVPMAAKVRAIDLALAAARHSQARNVRVTIAYVCIGGFNVGLEDAVALGELFRDVRIRLDLIDVTDPTGAFRPPTADELRLFRECALSSFGPTGGSALLGRSGHSRCLRHARGGVSVLVS